MNFYKTVEVSIGGNLMGRVSEALLSRSYLLGDYEFVPCDAPGLPPPGVDVINQAAKLAGLTGTTPEELSSQLSMLGMDISSFTNETGKKKRTDALNALKGVALRSSISALYMRLLYDPFCSLEAEASNKSRLIQTVPGHIWGDPRTAAMGIGTGPQAGRRRLMIIGKFPSDEEFRQCRYLNTAAGKEFARLLDDAGIEDWQEAYVTCLSRFFDNSHNRPTTLPDRWMKDCLPLVMAEIKIVQPQLVILLGSEPIKAMIRKGLSVGDAYGQVFPAEMDLRRYAGDEPTSHRFHYLACQHPASILHDPDHNTEPVRASILFLRDVITTGAENVAAEAVSKESDIDHLVIPSREHLASIADALIQANYLHFSIDAEWEGRYPTDNGSFMRCVQFSWAHKKAVLVPICNHRGEYYWPGGWEPTRAILERLWNRPGVRPIGHNFNADLVWLSHYGLKFLEDKFRAPKDDPDVHDPNWRPGFLKIKDEGGWDTMIGQHSVDELSDLSLKALLRRYTTIPNYEDELKRYIDNYCKTNKIAKGKITGYGFIPDEMLFKYALYDADGTFRLFEIQRGVSGRVGLLDSDRFQLPSWKPFWHTMRALPALLDIHRTGMLVDVPLAEELIARFEKARELKLEDLRTTINWEDFKPTSPPQCKALLFGDNFGKNSKGMLIRPAHVNPLNLTPYKTTGKKPKLFANLDPASWCDFTPSTDKEVMASIDDNPVVKKLQMFRFADQVLKIFRPKDKAAPAQVEDKIDEEVDGFVPDIATDQQFRIDAVPAVIPMQYVSLDMAASTYSGGIMSFICNDGRVRTLIFPTTETGRCRSAKPNMQNVTFKRRHKDFVKLLGDNEYYDSHPISSVFTAREGYLYIQADYKGAELVGMAVQAGDKKMIDYCMRNRLPEDDPNHICIHSKVAINAFNLRKPDGTELRPVAAELKQYGFKDMRDAAKPVDFGYAYGMTAETADRRIKEQVDNFIEGSGRLLIEGLEVEFPELPPYFSRIEEASQSLGYIQSCHGRRRRFRPTTDRKVIGDQKRQARNFPIQAFVADHVNIAMGNHDDFMLANRQSRVRLAQLQVHDALIWEVPIEEAEWFMVNALPFILYQNATFWPVTFDGRVLDDPNAPYRLAYDVEVGTRYGVPFSKPEQFIQLGLNPDVFKKL